MAGVNRVSETSRERSSVEAPPAAPLKTGGVPAFDATKAAVSNQIHGIRERSIFQEALEEATDGDNEEAIQRKMASGLDDGERPKDEGVLERVRKSKAGGPQQTSSEQSDQSATKSEQEVRAAEEAKGSAEVDSATTDEPDRKRQQRHHELMLLSSTMDRNQTASYVAQAAARRVQDVLEGSMWSRDTSRNKRLKIEQLLKVS